MEDTTQQQKKKRPKLVNISKDSVLNKQSTDKKKITQGPKKKGMQYQIYEFSNLCPLPFTRSSSFKYENTIISNQDYLADTLIIPQFVGPEYKRRIFFEKLKTIPSFKNLKKCFVHLTISKAYYNEQLQALKYIFEKQPNLVELRYYFYSSTLKHFEQVDFNNFILIPTIQKFSFIQVNEGNGQLMKRIILTIFQQLFKTSQFTLKQLRIDIRKIIPSSKYLTKFFGLQTIPQSESEVQFKLFESLEEFEFKCQNLNFKTTTQYSLLSLFRSVFYKNCGLKIILLSFKNINMENNLLQFIILGLNQCRTNVQNLSLSFKNCQNLKLSTSLQLLHSKNLGQLQELKLLFPNQNISCDTLLMLTLFLQNKLEKLKLNFLNSSFTNKHLEILIPKLASLQLNQFDINLAQNFFVGIDKNIFTTKSKNNRLDKAKFNFSSCLIQPKQISFYQLFLTQILNDSIQTLELKLENILIPSNQLNQLGEFISSQGRLRHLSLNFNNTRLNDHQIQNFIEKISEVARQLISLNFEFKFCKFLKSSKACICAFFQLTHQLIYLNLEVQQLDDQSKKEIGHSLKNNIFLLKSNFEFHKNQCFTNKNLMSLIQFFQLPPEINKYPMVKQSKMIRFRKLFLRELFNFFI